MTCEGIEVNLSQTKHAKDQENDTFMLSNIHIIFSQGHYLVYTNLCNIWLM